MQPVMLAGPNNAWDHLFASVGITCKYCLEIFGALFVCHRAPTICEAGDNHRVDVLKSSSRRALAK